MATASVLPDQDVVVVEIFIAAPPERVYQAISDPSQTSKWWGQKDLYRITGGSADVRPGGKWFSSGVGADGVEFRVEGEYLEVDPPRSLVHTWNPSYGNHPKATVVRWELEPRSVHGLHHGGPEKTGTGTQVRIRHSGFAGDAKDASNHGDGWKRVLGWMQAFVEQGETIDNRPSGSPK
jgi:uncharacterized protein YndB with AHSA1/START domain